MLYKDLTEKIIRAAMNTYNTLGFGFMEKVYENSLMIELELSRLKAIQQHPIKVFYKGIIVGDYIADIIVEDKIILELKSIENINKIHEVQLVNYLKAINKDVGILLNFGKEKLEFKRKVLNL
ncbi:MAG: GxxExxY protein [Candidatus Brocadiales bacterium]|jgi:GxxExxY protein|nr:GxxExxY protein [Candidatus Brocadiales bacterium]